MRGLYRLSLLPLAAVLFACTSPQQTLQPCEINTATPVAPASGFAVPAARVLDPTNVDVSTSSPSEFAVPENSVQAGQVFVSNCNDGVLRRVASVGPAVAGPGGVTAQGIRKVYIQTTEASLEDLVTAGDATIQFGDLALQPTSLVEAAPGVSVQATGTITLTNVNIPLAQGVTVTLNGSVQQTLNPRFRLNFSNGSVDIFEAGLSGNFNANLQARLTVTRGIPSWSGVTPIAQLAPVRRAFLVGSVPVVLVVTPRLVVGAEGGADSNITVRAGIAPNLSFNAGVRYDRDGAQRWVAIWTPPSFALNPTFEYSLPGRGNGRVYARMQMDVRFYGLIGPTLEAGPYMGLTLNPLATPADPLARLRAGAGGSGSVQGGFRVLGKGMDVGTPALSRDAGADYNCTASSCAAN